MAGLGVEILGDIDIRAKPLTQRLDMLLTAALIFSLVSVHS